MPHIIIEYSRNLVDDLNLPELLIDMHNALADTGIDKTRIKTRAIALDHSIVGDKEDNGAMMHCTLLLLEGRDIETKKNIGDKLYKLMSKNVTNIIQNCSVTLEIRDMDQETYYL